MADRPLSPEEAALWVRVLTSVRPLRVAPAPIVRMRAAVVKEPKVVPHALPTKTPLPGKGGVGGGSSAVQLFEKLLATGVGGQLSTTRAGARTHPQPLLSREGSQKRETANTLDGNWDKKLARGLVSPDHMIDLHGHNLSTAYATLDGALEQAIRQGDRVVLLVTGKPPRAESERPHARGAIRAAIGDWLAGSRHAGSIAAVRNAHPRHGGAGALYIILRKSVAKRIY